MPAFGGIMVNSTLLARTHLTTVLSSSIISMLQRRQQVKQKIMLTLQFRD